MLLSALFEKKRIRDAKIICMLRIDGNSAIVISFIADGRPEALRPDLSEQFAFFIRKRCIRYSLYCI